MQTIDIDIRGQICPSCLLLTLKEVNQNSSAIREGNAEIVVTTDDRQATATIPATVGRMGFRTEVTRLDAAYRIRVFGGD
ncbi:sulfurtransferase TusA family protein [Thiobacillus sedimenti]|uniref:Sulfurtransferase TusA family protein n=1 Tax=Thiobacillus sedimenti TaxID=3110231 RepID=A0ABZ1CGJ3_9PROT|nr:sulfurtransferase TusA family protein [Thiobacillus sp. SCUT-2]WRS38110.1 sulfurtransferase TusA family protein [Thiobacillus sp. SCUT-2]